MWNVSMKDESEGKKMFSEGEHVAEILEVELVTQEESKSGNAYFWWKLLMKEGEIEIRTTLIPKKRWLLKQLLASCGIEAETDDPEQKYSFEEKDVIGKTVVITVVNRESSFTGREGNKVTLKKSEVNRIQPYKKEKIEGDINQRVAGFIRETKETL